MSSDQTPEKTTSEGVVPRSESGRTVRYALDYRLLTSVSGLGLLLLGLLRGYRLPNAYAYTLSLIDYRTGFLKRGLMGQLLHSTGWTGYEAFAVVATVLLGVSMCALGLAIYHVARRNDARLWAAVLAFTTSYAVVYLAHLNGYLDHIGLTLTVATLAIRDWRRQLAVAVAAFSLGIVFHEAICIVFAPVVFGVLLVKVRREPGSRGLPWLVGGGVLLLVVLGFVGSAHMSRDEGMLQLARLEAEAGAPIHRMGLLSVLAGDYHDMMKFTGSFWSSWRSWAHLAQSLVVVLPTLALLLWVAAGQLRTRAREGWVRALALLAPLSPLAMHIAGIDTNRWNLLAMVTMFLAVFGLSRIPGPDDPANRRWSERLVVALVLVCVFNGIAAVPLFNEATCTSFPYFEHLYDILSTVIAAR